MTLPEDQFTCLTPARLPEAMARWREHAARSVVELSGTQWVRDYTRGIDRCLAGLFAGLARECERQTGRPPRTALLALGGFGRGELCLYSDLDLLFLTPESDGEEHDIIVKPFLYALWNTKWVIGPATRTLEQCADCFHEDWKSAVAMVEHRLLAGNRDAYRRFAEMIDQQLNLNRASWLLECLLREWSGRSQEGSSSVYLLEPNLKESLGGLRDIHFMRWLEELVYRRADGEGLIQAGVLNRMDGQRLNAAHAFLLQLRNALQRFKRKKVDRLDFESQIHLSRDLGFAHTDESLPEEKMLRAYYQHARNVFQLAQKTAWDIAQRTEKLTVLGIEDAPPVLLNEHFRRKGNTLALNPSTFVKIQHRTDLILQFFSLALDNDYRITVDSKEKIRSALEHLDRTLAGAPELGSEFFKMFSARRGLGRILREMHDCGFLDLLLPEFAQTTALIRLDFFHQYTVDEHLLRAVEQLERLDAGEVGPEAAFVKTAAGKIKRWNLLNLALLIHDAGKGQGRGHVLRGAQIARRVAERLGLTDQEAETLHFLVANHQKLSHLARRRDPNSKTIVLNLAREVKTVSNLNMLLVLTYCDMKAVGPNGWNDWVAKLLEQLYLNTLHALGAVDEAPFKRGLSRTKFLKTIRQYLEKQGVPLIKVRLFLENMSPRYLASTPLADMPYHIQLLDELDGNAPLVWRLRNRPDSKLSEITVVTDDRPGVFATLCGAFSSKGINIHSAQIHSTREGRALDIFYVTTLEGNPLPETFQMERLRQDVLDVIRGEKDVRLIQPAFRHPTPERYHPDRLAMRDVVVKFDNETSETHTVVEVKCPDCPWLLYTLTYTLARHHLNIDQAMITTEAYRVVDVFYVTDWENNKLDDQRYLEKLREDLTAALETLLNSYMTAVGPPGTP
ncbi:MAG: [protein-PII] uridylyltransferase [Candidatus Sumerlaeia bacterium]